MLLLYIEPPPSDVHLIVYDVNMNSLYFNWSAVSSSCPAVKYVVTAVNCGLCPSSTYFTSATCIINDILMADNMTCTFSIQTVVCEDIAGDASNHVTASIRGKCHTVYYSYYKNNLFHQYHYFNLRSRCKVQ